MEPCPWAKSKVEASLVGRDSYCPDFPSPSVTETLLQSIRIQSEFSFTVGALIQSRVGRAGNPKQTLSLPLNLQRRFETFVMRILLDISLQCSLSNSLNAVTDVSLVAKLSRRRSALTRLDSPACAAESWRPQTGTASGASGYLRANTS